MTENRRRFWRFDRARSEGSLALFSLSIIAIVVVLFTILAKWISDVDLPTELLTIASTAVGFIGGLLAGEKSSIRSTNPRLKALAEDANMSDEDFRKVALVALAADEG